MVSIDVYTIMKQNECGAKSLQSPSITEAQHNKKTEVTQNGKVYVNVEALKHDDEWERCLVGQVWFQQPW